MKAVIIMFDDQDFTSDGLQRFPFEDGCEIGYRDVGRGAPVVLAHAGVFSSWFLPLSQLLPRDRYRVLWLRRAGYGDGPRPGRHLRIADHAAHAAGLLDELGIEAAHWVGHSSSCLIGLQLAQDRPELVASLTLLEPAPGGELHGPADEQFIAATVAPAMAAYARGDLPGAFDLFMRGVGGAGYRAVLSSRLGAAGVQAAQQESGFFFADELSAVREWRFGAAQAARIWQPALVVLGEHSPRVTPPMVETVQRLTGMLPHARRHTLPEASHLMPLQQPGQLAQLISQFIAQPFASTAADVLVR